MSDGTPDVAESATMKLNAAPITDQNRMSHEPRGPAPRGLAIAGLPVGIVRWTTSCATCYNVRMADAVLTAYLLKT